MLTLLKSREKTNTGVLRILVYEIIWQSLAPISICEIMKEIHRKGYIATQRTLNNIMNEILLSNEFLEIQLKYVIVKAGRSRAKAFYFTKKEK